MLRFVLRRLFSAVPTIFIVVTMSFFLIRFAPGGPFNVERALPPQIMANLMRAYQLDQPIWQQYFHYLWNVLHLDFGPSYIYRDFTVTQLIAQSLPYSLELGTFAMVIALVGGVAAGVVALRRAPRATGAFFARAVSPNAGRADFCMGIEATTSLFIAGSRSPSRKTSPEP